MSYSIRPVRLTTSPLVRPLLRDRAKGAEWGTLDPWWAIFADRTAPDGWWDVYTETGHDTAITIRDLLVASNERWATGRGPFHTDPLATDVATERALLGPLQPTDELQWSHWLAELLCVPAFAEQALGRAFADEHITVAREDSYDRERGDGGRRADIVLRQGGTGVSIEVKLFDTRYAKTAETATLVEGAAGISTGPTLSSCRSHSVGHS